MTWGYSRRRWFHSLALRRVLWVLGPAMVRVGVRLVSMVSANASAIASALSGLCLPVERICSFDSSWSCPLALYRYVRDAS